MNITDDDVLLPLKCVYLKTQRATLICEVKKDVTNTIVGWEVYIDGEFHGLGVNMTSTAPLTHMYYPIDDLVTEQEYDAYVIAVAANGDKSHMSDTIKFTPMPPF